MKHKTAEEIIEPLKRYADFHGNQFYYIHPQDAIDAMEAYRLQGAENLPNDEAIKAICSTDTTREGIIGAKWMRSEASAIIDKKDEEIVLKDKRIAHWRNENFKLQEDITTLRAEKEELKEEFNKVNEQESEYYKANLKLQSEISTLRKENEQLKKPCTHKWVSSVAYKGARVCTKCGMIK